MGSERKVILYIATSLDGYIAGMNDDLGFLSLVEQEGEDYGYETFMQSVDTILIGRKTYDKVNSMGYPYPGPDRDVEVYVITHSVRPDHSVRSFDKGLTQLHYTIS